jgi:hypothetical protein
MNQKLCVIFRVWSFPNRQNEFLHYSDRMALERKTEKTSMSEKDKLAAEAIDRWGDFQ